MLQAMSPSASHPELARLADAIRRWAADLPLDLEPAGFQAALDRSAPDDEAETER
jgi:hypothetical protein